MPEFTSSIPTPVKSSPLDALRMDIASEFKKTFNWDAFEHQLDDCLINLEKLMGNSVNLLRLSQGKRIRPLLVFASCALFKSPNSNTVKAAIASELIHMASLVHDDIIDNSSLRRGRPSVNSLYGNHAAVLLGDALFAESFKILASPELLRTMGHYIRAIQGMCMGEIQQGLAQYDTNRSLNTYLRHISLKTGVLIEASCQAGAETAHSSKEQVESLREFGDYLGLAFQIADDILDFVGQEDTLGKPVFADLRQGNYTLPVIYLLNDEIYGKWFKEIIQKNYWQPAIILQIRQALQYSGVLTKSKDLAKMYINSAKACLDAFPHSIAREFLEIVCDNIVLKLT